MLASLFSKTKPINYFITSVLLIVFYFLFIQTTNYWPTTGYEYFKRGVLLLLLFISTTLVQFIGQRNRLTGDNSYAPLLFVCFLILFPSALINPKIIVANYFVILALRRLFSMHSLKAPKEKIFDAALWIFVAVLFHFWSILFLGLLFLAIVFYVSSDYRNWMIPFVALFTVSVFLGLYLVGAQVDLLNFVVNSTKFSFDFTYFNNVYQNIALAIFSSIAVLFFVSQVLALPSKPFNMQTSYKKIIITFLIGIAIYIFSADKNNGTLLFTFFPLSILGANYLENLPNKWMREVVVSVILGIALFIFFSQTL